MSIVIFSLCVLALLIVGLFIMVLALTRQVGVLFERVAPIGAMINDSGPKIGEVSPAFNLPSLTGGMVQIGTASPTSTLIFFLSPTCPICKKLLPVLKSIRQTEANVEVILASDGEQARHEHFIQSAGLLDFPYVISEQLGVTYKVSRLPFAVLLDGEGVVKSKGLVNSREQLESLFVAVETGYESIQDFSSRNAHS